MDALIILEVFICVNIKIIIKFKKSVSGGGAFCGEF